MGEHLAPAAKLEEDHASPSISLPRSDRLYYAGVGRINLAGGPR
jgi:hypothetical protein